VDDRVPTSRQTIDEGRFSDVGPSDYGNYRQGHGKESRVFSARLNKIQFSYCSELLGGFRRWHRPFLRGVKLTGGFDGGDRYFTFQFLTAEVAVILLKIPPTIARFNL
jgi:hypothetical protein